MRPAGWLVVLALGAGADAYAEAPRDDQLRVDVGMTGAVASITDRNGVGFVAEIKMNVHDHLAIGGRVEMAVMFGGQVRDEDLPFGLVASGLLKGEYLLGTGPVRPYAGAGVGVYSMASHTIVRDDDGASGISTTSGRYVGVAPEAGIDLGRLRLAVTYHAILGTSVEYRHTSGGVEHRESYPHRYLSLQASLRFGSGRRSAAPRVSPRARRSGTGGSGSAAGRGSAARSRRGARRPSG